MKIVVAQRGINRNLPLTPNAGFGVPNLPVVDVVTVVNDIACKADEGGLGLGNCLHQSDAHRRICRFGVFGIVEAGVSVGDKVNGVLTLICKSTVLLCAIDFFVQQVSTNRVRKEAQQQQSGRKTMRIVELIM